VKRMVKNSGNVSGRVLDLRVVVALGLRGRERKCHGFVKHEEEMTREKSKGKKKEILGCWG